ncbi:MULTISPECIES: Rne/Rng family ribonuclease [unclassified Synechococcus]|uniref:Rne/Rng family ribonuclease n=1 Tax=unclassified Synechococcus TaxID=2626047 RepID=UPI0021A85627|nr:MULTISPECIES: Rne/Rng family ribonuclease [unclassified Synechococcus]MCT0213727.1 Rne/Rng family ribonuclease [Synechococcus sp. CS-1326]MCT0233757.1 Rne/Rng family ribonuclease [Synechococcus sp. CS-1327]
MPQQIVIAEQLRIAAVLNDERVDELVVAQGRYQIGDVYLGRVENVLPGIDAAFVNIGESEKNGFIHVTDLGPLRLRKGAAGITELLEPRQKVLVQVMKEPTGTKGPRLTGNLTLPGRFLVLQPHGQGVSISRRINGENERNRLRALGVLIKPPGAGLLVRTEAEGVSEELLIDDLEALLRQWEAIQEAAETASPPVLLNRDEDFIHRVLRDLYSPEVLSVVVDTPSAVARVNAFLGSDQDNLLVEHHADSTSILEHYRVNAAIRDSLKPRAELPSGGYVIIEPTEALTVIDVNSGSFTRSANARETVLWTNCEAAAEIARQLKLRNIGGVVIIDFIDMESRRDQLMLLEHFTQAVRNDNARPQIAQLSELGLVELTRKRQGQNIYELFGRACPSCGGLGHVAVLPGTDTLQPLANVSGLVRSAASARAEVPSPATGEPAGRRRSGRGGRGGRSAEPIELAAPLPLPGLDPSPPSEGADSGFVAEPLSRRQVPELVAVPMETDQELVYGWLGLSPALLLDSPSNADQLIVRVVRPGDDPDAVLESARQQQSASGSRRRRRGGRGGQDTPANGRAATEDGPVFSSPAFSSPVFSSPADQADVLVEITPLPMHFDESRPIVTTVIEAPLVQVPLSRKVTRTRSSSSSEEPVSASLPDNGNHSTTGVATPPDPEPEAEAGEPRRRRRRSSATV